EGEVSFDLLTKKLKCECLILNDLLLTQNNTTFQTDTLIIAHGKIHLFEIKNNTGDHYYESDHMYHISGVKLCHPVHQLERNQSVIQQATSISLATHYIHNPNKKSPSLDEPYIITYYR